MHDAYSHGISYTVRENIAHMVDAKASSFTNEEHLHRTAKELKGTYVVTNRVVRYQTGVEMSACSRISGFQGRVLCGNVGCKLRSPRVRTRCLTRNLVRTMGEFEPDLYTAEHIIVHTGNIL